MLDEEKHIYHLKETSKNKGQKRQAKKLRRHTLQYTQIENKVRARRWRYARRWKKRRVKSNRFAKPQEIEALKEAAYKISAIEYLADLKPEILQELEELEKLEDEICDLLNGIEDDEFRRVFEVESAKNLYAIECSVCFPILKIWRFLSKI